jgi:serine/threonine-protein kinase HipA
VKNALQLIEEVKDAISEWDTIAKDCGVSKTVRQEVKKSLEHINKNK